MSDTGWVDVPYDLPTAILPDALWISGSPIDCEWLGKTGVSLVVDVADPELRIEASQIGTFTYCKEALVDGPELPTAATLDRLVDDVVAAVRNGRRVLVACAGGRNRSGLVVALAVRELLGCSGAEAVQRVQSLRQDALNNQTFAQHIAALPAPATAQR